MTRAVGLALVQFIWQGAAIGAATALLLIALRRASAHARYVVGCLSLAAMCAAPIVTVVRALTDGSSIATEHTAPDISQSASRSPTAASDVSGEPQTGSPYVLGASTFSATIEPWLPAVVLIWSAGVLILALQLFRGWMRLRRTRSTATLIALADWPGATRAMAERLGVVHRVRLIASALTDVPAVIGWLRPAIVVPVSVLAGLPPAHLDAILAHELAHVRRWDFFVNVAQCVVEVLLFYHPAVWWVSRQIRLEREHCCDDLAASLCGNRVAYAHALASLEEFRGERPRLAMAADGGNLVNRVRRQVQPGFSSGPRFSGGVAMGIVLAILLCVGGSYVNGAAGSPDAPKTSSAQSLHPAPAPVIVAPGPVIEKAKPVLQATRRTMPVQTTQATPPRDPLPPAPQGRGRMIGRVFDRDGGVIPGASVKVTSVALPGVDIAGAITTNSAGRFEVPSLPAGSYEVTAVVQGFKTAKVVNVQVVANEEARLDIKLEIGALSETVQIKGRPGLTAVNTEPAPYIPYPSTADEAFSAARLLYGRGRLAEAELMTNRAFDLLQSSEPQHTVTFIPPVDPNAPIQPIRVGGNIREPKRTVFVEPIYPPEALAANTQGYVTIEAVVSTNGSVKNARVVKGNPQLDAAALGAVRLWRYQPASLNGRPLEVATTVIIIFSTVR